jgi:hypothetical protein
MAWMRFAALAVACAAAALTLPASAQSDAAQCILAGRINAEGEWAPRFDAVQLRGADGAVIARTDRASLTRVRQAELAQPALLARCDGDNPMAIADDEAPGRKAAVPALSAGVVEVESVAFPKLRTGGHLVELKVRAPAERVVMLTR